MASVHRPHCEPTHSQSVSQSLTHSLTHSQSVNHSQSLTVTQSLWVGSLTHTRTHALLTHSLTRSLHSAVSLLIVRSFVVSLLFVDVVVRSFVRSLIRLFCWSIQDFEYRNTVCLQTGLRCCVGGTWPYQHTE